MNKYEFDKAVYASDMNKNAKAVALCYAFHSDWKTGGGIYVSRIGVADETGIHRNTVAEWAKWLVKNGWLTPVGKTQKNVTMYELSIPAPSVAQPSCNSVEPEEVVATPACSNREVNSGGIKGRELPVAQTELSVAQSEEAVAQPAGINVFDLTKNLIDEPDGSSDELDDSWDSGSMDVEREGAGGKEPSPIPIPLARGGAERKQGERFRNVFKDSPTDDPYPGLTEYQREMIAGW